MTNIENYLNRTYQTYFLESMKNLVILREGTWNREAEGAHLWNKGGGRCLTSHKGRETKLHKGGWS